MAYKAIVIPVMIASPGDVTEESGIIRKVIYDWNDMHSEKEGVILYPKGWDTHSSPELKIGMRGQDLINIRVLRNCDLFIGVFWTRIGTPTGKTNSGTVEEIEEHVNKGKPAMVYFSGKPKSPNNIDKRQYQKVLSFKEKCKKLGLIGTFNSTEELKDSLTKELASCLNHNEYIKSVIETERKALKQTDKSENNQQRDEPQLSDEARTLLEAAANTQEGNIFKDEYIGGQGIQSGDKQYGKNNRREFSKWVNALEELQKHRLIKPMDEKCDLFELNHRGWELADSLKNEDK